MMSRIGLGLTAAAAIYAAGWSHGHFGRGEKSVTVEKKIIEEKIIEVVRDTAERRDQTRDVMDEADAAENEQESEYVERIRIIERAPPGDYGGAADRELCRLALAVNRARDGAGAVEPMPGREAADAACNADDRIPPPE